MATMKLDNLNLPQIDLEKAAAGVWVPYSGDIRFLIARSDSPEYVRAIKQLERRFGTQLTSGAMTDNEADRLLAGLMVDHILNGWEGLQNDEEEFPYNRENALALMADPSYADLRAWIMKQAGDIENYRREKVKKSETKS